jgi:hypothetical protein
VTPVIPTAGFAARATRACSSLSRTSCNCCSNLWFWEVRLSWASWRSCSRDCIRSFRAESFRSAIATSFFKVEFCSTSYHYQLAREQRGTGGAWGRDWGYPALNIGELF